VYVISPEMGANILTEVDFFDHKNFHFYNLGPTKSALERIKQIFDYFSNSKRPVGNALGTGSTVQRLKPFVTNLIKTICFPDEELEFLIKSRGFLKGFDASKFDLLISSSPYFSSHVAAKGLKDRFPSLYWIADYRDTFSYNATYRVPNWRRLIDAQFEKKITSRADVITTVSKAYKIQLEKILGIKRPKIIVIPSGYRSFKYNRKNGCGLINEGKITITYFGQFFATHYPVTPVCRVLKKLAMKLSEKGKKVKFEFYGCSNMELFEGLSKTNVNYEFFDRIPRHEVRDLQRKSNLNIFFSNGIDEAFGLSHLKLFEYLDAGKPILGIVNGKTDEVAKIKKIRTNVTLVDISDCAETIEKTLNDLAKVLILNLTNDHNYHVRPLLSRSSKKLAKMMIDAS